MASLDVPPSYPPPPPPKRPVRPKITLQIPDAPSPMTPRTAPIYYGSPRFPKAPGTPGSHMSDPHHPYFSPFGHMYHSKASEFMFKQFEGFKDFTMNTAKSGLSVGEKTAFWLYNKLRVLSKRWFTHLFLSFSLALYSVIGAAVFMALESGHEGKFDKNLTNVRREVADKIMDIVVRNNLSLQDPSLDLLTYIEPELAEYEARYTECIKHLNDNNTHKNTWSFWNSMFYAGTVYTTIARIGYVSEAVGRVQVQRPKAARPKAELHRVPRRGHQLVYNKYKTFGTMTINFRHRTKYLCITWHFYFMDIIILIQLCEWNLIVVVMSEEASDKDITLTLKIPVRKVETEVQTSSALVIKPPDVIEPEPDTMETEQDRQNISIRKRRNLSKNRGQAARQREKTPEPNRTPIPHEDTPTSEDEEHTPRDPREAEADDTYEEMKRLVQERANTKDPVYDLDTDEILEARAMAQNDRRRRSISPFALLDKEQEEASKLERKGSFIDPTNKLLSTSYTLSPKDDSRRDSLVIEPPKDLIKSLSPSSPTTASPKEKEIPNVMPSTPKKQEQLVYPDEKKSEVVPKKPKTPVKNEEVFTFDDKEIKQSAKTTLKTPETPLSPGELVTKVIQLERSPSKKITQDKKPAVVIRERIVRTPSRKSIADAKPIVIKQTKPKDEHQPQSRVPPVKPARSKSANRFGSKTSESEMSEDQANQNYANAAIKRKIVPTPRRFQKNRSPKSNRSQSINRAETVKVVDRVDRTGTGMSQTSREIIELMQKARARSLSIPKDDPRLPSPYKNIPESTGKARVLKTPNKTPNTLRQSRGISCPKTIQIISNKEILSGLTNSKPKPDLEQDKHSRQSSGYIDASQSEYTSSCYSSSPSENEYEFDLSERTAELTRKLNILSQEVDRRETINNIILAPDDIETTKTEVEKPVLRKRSVHSGKIKAKKENKEVKEVKNKIKADDKKKQVTRSRWRIIANWQQFKSEQNVQYVEIRLLRNRCVCDLLLLIIFLGMGGMMFKNLEGSFENAFKCGSRGMKRDFIESLWRGSHYLREEDWKSMARTKLFEFENQLHTAHEAGVTSYSGQRSWNFMNSFVYCMTLVTTIGYGHIAPKTTYGRVATIVYAIIGIPLFLIVLADFGKLFTRIIKFFWAFIRRFYYTRSCRKVRRTVPVQEVMKGLNIVYDVVRRPSQIFSEEDENEINGAPNIERKPSDVPPPLPPKPGHLRDPENDTEPETPSVFEIDDEFNLPISLAIFILVVYIVIGALGFNIWEKWNFFESFYFVFISMSTIGLGDFVPDHPMFMMASILYLIFGLALTSMCINVVQVKLTNTFRQASAKLGATIGLKVAEEDGSLVPNTPPATEIAPVHKPKTEIDEKSKETDENDSKNR